MLKLKKVALYAAAAACLALLSLSEIYNMRPFGTGAYLALALTSVPVYVTAPVYFLSSAAFCTTPAEVWGYAAVCVAVVILKLIFIGIKRRPPLYAPMIAATVGSCGFIYAAVIGDITPLNLILSFLFSLLFMLVSFVFAKPLLEERLNARLTEIELVCGCCVLAATLLALSRPIASVFAFSYAFAAFVTLAALYCSGTGAGVAVALSAGIGMAALDMDPAPIAVVALAAALAAVFVGGHRLLAAAGYILGFAAAAFLFEAADLWALLSASIGTAAFVAIPSRLWKRLRTAVKADAHESALICVFNRERRKIGAEISCAAEIFGQMSGIMANVSGAGVSAEAYADRLLTEVCSTCAYAENCMCRNKSVMTELVARAVADGHTSVPGLPQPVLDNCRCMGQLLGKTNTFVDKSREEAAEMRAYLGAARLISSQLGGAEGIMRKVGSRLNANAALDTAGAKRIEEELVYGGQNCAAALVLVSGGEKEVSVVVRESSFDKARTLDVLRKVYRQPFSFVSADAEDAPAGYVAARFKSGAPLDVVFGVSALGKDGGSVSGDTYSFTRIGAGGFMMALSDGMGSGENAHGISETAVSLVENYYRAGFDSAFVLASVNRFLSMKRDESFSAMDIVVLDLMSASGDVIKIGCPPTYVRRNGETAQIGGDSLPLGVIEDMTPYCESVKFCEGDMIVMMSDGVADCFDAGEAGALIAHLDTNNPQTLSRAVLDAALKNIGGVQRDDMTVLAGRIYRGI